MATTSSRVALLCGLDRRFQTPAWAALYGAVTAAGLVGLVLVHTVPFQLAAGAMLASYSISQSLFVAIHLTLHRQFVECDWRDLTVGPLFAETHHYHETTKDGVFTEAWLLYRLSYFVTVGQDGRVARLGGTAALTHVVHIAAIVASLGTGRLAATTACLYLGWHNLQAVVHAWYHIRPRHRHRHLMPSTVLAMELLEHAGLISRLRHRRHHLHDRLGRERVVAFFDIRAPEPINRLAEAVHRWLGRATARGWSSHWIATVVLGASHGLVLFGALTALAALTATYKN